MKCPEPVPGLAGQAEREGLGSGIVSGQRQKKGVTIKIAPVGVDDEA